MMAFHNASSNWSDCCMNASAAGTSVRACMIMGSMSIVGVEPK